MTVGELIEWLKFEDPKKDVVLECHGYDILRHIDRVSSQLRYTHPLGEMYKGSPWHRTEPGNDSAITLEYHL
jgi:hypothetical protein